MQLSQMETAREPGLVVSIAKPPLAIIYMHVDHVPDISQLHLFFGVSMDRRLHLLMDLSSHSELCTYAQPTTEVILRIGIMSTPSCSIQLVHMAPFVDPSACTLPPRYPTLATEAGALGS